MSFMPTRFLKAAVNRISARNRIVIGQVFLLVSVLWLAMTLGMVPSEQDAARKTRASLCETVAIYGTVFVERQAWGDSPFRGPSQNRRFHSGPSRRSCTELGKRHRPFGIGFLRVCPDLQ
jgi:hypothetical protein